MTTHATSRCSAGFALPLLLGLAGLLLLAGPAQAQLGGEVCPDIEDVSDDALDFYLEELDSEFGIDLDDEDLCQALTENFIKACQKAVGDAVKCVQNQLKTLTKQNQLGCKGTLSDDAAKACSNASKEVSKTLSEIAKSDGEFESNRCEDTLAFEYLNTCLFGD